MRVGLVFVPFVAGHSWLLQIGDRGLKRGGLEGDDHAKTRYYCPFEDLSKCIAPNSAVVLPPDVRRACQPGKSVPMGAGVAGGELYLGWQGNGHVGKAEGSCVSVSITSYASDPDLSSFQRLVDCAPFHRGWSPDLTVTLPASLASGDYTIWWVWHFAGFFYSSCADISVSRSAALSVPVKKLSIAEALALPYDRVDCAALDDPDGFCITKFGTTIPTYCKKHSKNSCGFSVCQGYDIIDPCFSSNLSTVGGAPVVGAPLNATELSLALDFTDCRSVSQPDEWCRRLTGNPGSHCKSWSADVCGRAHCFAHERPMSLSCSSTTVTTTTPTGVTTTPATTIVPTAAPTAAPSRTQVGCESAPKPHEYCRVVFGRGSYCKLEMRDRCGRSWCFGQLTMTPCKAF